MEAARAWNAVCNIHRTIYGRYGYWLSEGAIKALLKGKYCLHSQSVQAVVGTYFECCERTRELHLQGYTEWKHPYRRKRFFTVTWKKAAITHKGRILKLSNGWGREPLIVKLPKRITNAAILQAQLVWHRNQYWLHVTVEKPALLKVQGNVCAAIDPGKVHALTITDGNDALVISGRLLRSLNRLRNKVLRQLQRAISKTKEGSRKRRKLLAKKYRFLNWVERRIEHILHAISASAVRWCLGRSVRTVYIGNPEGVRERDCGRKHNQRMGQWALGKLRDLLAYKLKRHGIELIPVDERGTSGTCPVCGGGTPDRLGAYTGAAMLPAGLPGFTGTCWEPAVSLTKLCTGVSPGAASCPGKWNTCGRRYWRRKERPDVSTMSSRHLWTGPGCGDATM